MSGDIRDDEYELLRLAVHGCTEEGTLDEVLDRVLSVVEDIIDERERPLRELCTEWATKDLEINSLGVVIRQNVEQQCAHDIFEILNEFLEPEPALEEEREDDTA